MASKETNLVNIVCSIVSGCEVPELTLIASSTLFFCQANDTFLKEQMTENLADYQLWLMS